MIVARQRQQERFRTKPRVTCNAWMGSREVKQHCFLNESAQGMLPVVISDLNFSARAYDRILKVARTIADLTGSEAILADHIGETIQFRSLDRQIWG